MFVKVLITSIYMDIFIFFVTAKDFNRLHLFSLTDFFLTYPLMQHPDKQIYQIGERFFTFLRRPY